MEPYARRGICQNVDFFSGAIYYLLDIPEDLFISIFAMGRIPGWTVQVMEQFDNNILLRPRLLYVGDMDVEYVPIDRAVSAHIGNLLRGVKDERKDDDARGS